MGNNIESRALAEQIINKAIQEVVCKYNAYAPIISSFRVVYDNMVPTIGVDKYSRLIINPQFIVENQEYAEGLIIHEVLHVFFGHTSDTRSKLAYNNDAQHNKIVNIAEDCAINQFIREPLPENGVNPSTLRDMFGIDKYINLSDTAEYYYDVIMENVDTRNATINNYMCSTDEVNGDKIQDELERMGVEHISQEEVNEKVMETATEICKTNGLRYGNLYNIALEKLNPKVDWRPLLQATVRNAEKKVWSIHSRQTYKRISRRSGQILMPKRYGNKISVALSFDTSGSISQDMVNQFLSEIQACLRYSEIKECSLWHTDNYWYGTPQELKKNIESVFQSGGTDESCMGNAEKHCRADLYIHFSDGYHGDNYGFEHPHKNIEIVWDEKEIKEIRKEF